MVKSTNLKKNTLTLASRPPAAPPSMLVSKPFTLPPFRLPPPWTPSAVPAHVVQNLSRKPTSSPCPVNDTPTPLVAGKSPCHSLKRNSAGSLPKTAVNPERFPVPKGKATGSTPGVLSFKPTSSSSTVNDTPTPLVASKSPFHSLKRSSAGSLPKTTVQTPFPERFTVPKGKAMGPTPGVLPPGFLSHVPRPPVIKRKNAMDVDDSSSPSPSYQRPPPDLKRKAMDVASANSSLFEPRLDFKRRTGEIPPCTVQPGPWFSGPPNVPVAPPSPMRLSFTEPRLNLKRKPIVVDPPPIIQSNNWDEDVSMEDLAVSALAETLAALTIAGPISRSRGPSRPNYLPLTVASPPFINPQPFIAQSLSLRPPTASSVASSSSYFASPAPSGLFGSAAPSSSYSAPAPLASPNFFVPLVPPHTGRNAPRSSLPFSLVPSVPPVSRSPPSSLPFPLIPNTPTSIPKDYIPPLGPSQPCLSPLHHIPAPIISPPVLSPSVPTPHQLPQIPLAPQPVLLTPLQIALLRNPPTLPPRTLSASSLAWHRAPAHDTIWDVAHRASLGPKKPHRRHPEDEFWKDYNASLKRAEHRKFCRSSGIVPEGSSNKYNSWFYPGKNLKRDRDEYDGEAESYSGKFEGRPRKRSRHPVVEGAVEVADFAKKVLATAAVTVLDTVVVVKKVVGHIRSGHADVEREENWEPRIPGDFN